MTVRTLARKPARTAAVSVLVVLGLAGCYQPLRAPFYAPTAYQTAPVYQPAPAYQQPVYRPAPTSPRPYYYGQQPPQPPPPAELFDPPPGPITDFCASELQERLAIRNALIAKGAMHPYIADADRKVRRTWEVCQKQYLTALEMRANANSRAGVVATQPPQADQPTADVPQPDGGSSQPIDPAPPVAEATGDQPVPTPPPPEPEAPAADQPPATPRPVKLTPAQRKAAAEREEKRKAEAAEREEKRKAERAAKKAEKEDRARQARAAAEELVRAYCGPEPERSAWDGIYIGVERYFKKVANDPDSVEFTGCGEAVLKGPPKCWVTTCGVRAKNGFGAKILRAYTFHRNADGWTDVSD